MAVLNEPFDEYRDCLRLVWNYALRHRLKGLVSYPDVSRALLEALVLDELPAATNARNNNDGCVAGLGVAISATRPKVLVARVGQQIDWTTADVGSEAKGKILYYVDLFDFRDQDQMLDLDYVKAISSSEFGAVKKGDLVLLHRADVDIVSLGVSGELF